MPTYVYNFVCNCARTLRRVCWRILKRYSSSPVNPLVYYDVGTEALCIAPVALMRVDFRTVRVRRRIYFGLSRKTFVIPLFILALCTRHQTYLLCKTTNTAATNCTPQQGRTYLIFNPQSYLLYL